MEDNDSTEKEPPCVQRSRRKLRKPETGRGSRRFATASIRGACEEAEAVGGGPGEGGRGGEGGAASLAASSFDIESERALSERELEKGTDTCNCREIATFVNPNKGAQMLHK